MVGEQRHQQELYSYRDITWVPWHLKSLATQMFVQRLMKAKKISKLHITGTLWGESRVTRHYLKPWWLVYRCIYASLGSKELIDVMLTLEASNLFSSLAVNLDNLCHFNIMEWYEIQKCTYLPIWICKYIFTILSHNTVHIYNSST